MENSPIPRAQNEGPNWGPPARRAVVSQGQAEATVATAQPAPPQQSQPPPPPYGSALPPPTPWPAPGAGQSPGRPQSSTAIKLGQIGRAPGWIIAVVVAASILLELGFRTRLNSVATLLATMAVAGLVLGAAARRRPIVALPLLVALLGAAVAVLRASLWVTMPTLLMVGASLVLAGQGRLLDGGLLSPVVRYLGDTGLSVGWLLQPLRERRGNTIGSLGRRVFLAALAVVPLAMLLASADAVFGQLLSSADPGTSWQHALLTALIVPFVASIALASRRTGGAAEPGNDRGAPGTGRPGGSPLSITDAMVVLGSVGVLLAIWGATQVVVALGGADRLLATANLTAAENARQGFFQLVAATAFLVCIIVAVDRYTDRTAASDRLRFLGFTVLIGLETLGVVVATYSRLALYISGFGNTMLRASVAWFLAWLAAVMVVLVVSVNRKDGRRWFGTVLFSSVALWVLAFGLWNPEAKVATGNLARGDQAAEIDYRYLGGRLGTDAMPAMIELLPTMGADHRETLTEDLCRQADDLGGGYPILSWNRSHAKATAALESIGC